MSLTEAAPSRRHAFSGLVGTGVWLFATLVGLYLKPAAAGHGTHQELGLPPCPSVLFFDRPCPGCGLTTSWTALLHGDWRMAFHAHALGPILYLGFTIYALGTLVLAVQGRRWKDGPWMTPVLVSIFTVFIGYGAIRMALTPHYATGREQVLRAYMGAKG